MEEIKQAVAPKTQPFEKEAFMQTNTTVIRWLGSAGIFINSRGTCIMIDPLLEGFDMPLLIDMPILPHQVPRLDGVFITHIDNDHFSRVTCRDLKAVCKEYHGPHYVAEEMVKEGLLGKGHDIHETFTVGNIKTTLTPADHAWQNEKPKYREVREYKFEDYCGFWLDTPDGTIWLPGDSRLLKEQLQMPTPDAILFDFSDNAWHIGFKDAVKLANTYPNTPLLLIHWGSVDAPMMDAFNGNPLDLYSEVVNPSRIIVLAPGQEYLLKQ